MERTQLAQTLLELLENETGEKHPPLDDAMDLREGLNLDSLDMVSLVLHIENRLQISIDTDELNDVATVGGLLDLLERKSSTQGRRHAA